MTGSFSNWEEIVRKAFDHLEPGGYLEMHDNTFPLKCDDGTMSVDFKPLKWTNLVIEFTDRIGRTTTAPRRFEKLLTDAGFVNVQLRRAKWPLSSWSREKKLKDLDTWVQASSVSGIEAVSLGLFTRVLNWSIEETRAVCSEVRCIGLEA